MNNPSPTNQILTYTGKNGQPSIKVKTDGETVWLTQAQLAELFGTSKQNISEHIKNIFTEGELDAAATVQKFEQSKPREIGRFSGIIENYNLDMIISLGIGRARRWPPISVSGRLPACVL